MGDRLAGKVAVVTGGASGMGAATAKRFVAEGASVVMADIQVDKGEDLAEALGPAARFQPCDVRSEEDLAAAVALAQSSFGGLDAMVHFAAASGVQDSIEEMDVAAWDDTMALHTRASMLVVKVSIAAMRERGGGSIMLTSSVAGFRPQPHSPAGYVTGKAALQGLAKVAAFQCAPSMIRVNTIVPGGFAAPIHLTRLGYSQDLADKMAPHLARLLFDRYQALPRAGTGNDFANAALFLASDEASWLTGVELPVDGGLMLHRMTGAKEFREAVETAESLAASGQDASA